MIGFLEGGLFRGWDFLLVGSLGWDLVGIFRGWTFSKDWGSPFNKTITFRLKIIVHETV